MLEIVENVLGIACHVAELGYIYYQFKINDTKQG